MHPVQQDAKLKDRRPKKKDSPVENRTSGNPNLASILTRFKADMLFSKPEMDEVVKVSDLRYVNRSYNK